MAYTEYYLRLTMKFDNEVGRTEWYNKIKVAVGNQQPTSAAFVSAILMKDEAQFPTKESEVLPGGTG